MSALHRRRGRLDAWRTRCSPHINLYVDECESGRGETYARSRQEREHSGKNLTMDLITMIACTFHERGS
jgi:hypothetical protein